LGLVTKTGGRSSMLAERTVSSRRGKKNRSESIWKYPSFIARIAMRHVEGLERPKAEMRHGKRRKGLTSDVTMTEEGRRGKIEGGSSLPKETYCKSGFIEKRGKKIIKSWHMVKGWMERVKEEELTDYLLSGWKGSFKGGRTYERPGPG